MAIQYQENGRIFTLHTDHSTYQMKADSPVLRGQDRGLHGISAYLWGPGVLTQSI